MSVPFSKKILKIFTLLHKVGSIKDFVITGNLPLKKIRFSVFFYKNTPFFKNIKAVSTPSKKFFISKKGLSLLLKGSKSTIFILSTNKGLLTAEQALSLGVGGTLLYTIN